MRDSRDKGDRRNAGRGRSPCEEIIIEGSVAAKLAWSVKVPRWKNLSSGERTRLGRNEGRLFPSTDGGIKLGEGEVEGALGKGKKEERGKDRLNLLRSHATA